MRMLSVLLVSLVAFAAEPKDKKDVTDKKETITITVGELVQAQAALSKLFNFDLPVKTAWSLRKTVAAVEVEYKNFNDQRAALLKKYGDDKKADTMMVPPEKLDAFNADFKTLTAIKLQLAITKISMDTLSDAIKLSPADMMHLEPFITP